MRYVTGEHFGRILNLFLNRAAEPGVVFHTVVKILSDL
jgi:hypothetical protein